MKTKIMFGMLLLFTTGSFFASENGFSINWNEVLSLFGAAVPFLLIAIFYVYSRVTRSRVVKRQTERYSVCAKEAGELAAQKNRVDKVISALRSLCPKEVYAQLSKDAATVNVTEINDQLESVKKWLTNYCRDLDNGTIFITNLETRIVRAKRILINVENAHRIYSGARDKCLKWVSDVSADLGEMRNDVRNPAIQRRVRDQFRSVCGFVDKINTSRNKIAEPDFDWVEIVNNLRQIESTYRVVKEALGKKNTERVHLAPVAPESITFDSLAVGNT